MHKTRKLNIKKIEDFSRIFDKNNLIDLLCKQNKWNKICAAMDSIRVGVAIINRIKWDQKEEYSFAFPLIELLTGGQMIKKGVIALNWAVFDIKYELFDDKLIFDYLYNLTDDDVFREYRALAFAHTVDFKRDNKISNGEQSYFSYLIWEDGNNTIATALQYPSDKEIKINYNAVFNYVEKRYNYLEKIKENLFKKFNINDDFDKDFDNFRDPPKIFIKNFRDSEDFL